LPHKYLSKHIIYIYINIFFSGAPHLNVFGKLAGPVKKS